jgi:histidine decarboxylase
MGALKVSTLYRMFYNPYHFWVNKHDNFEQAELKKFYNQIINDLDLFVGFPVATDVDYSELTPIFNVFLNNIGDPYDDSGLFRAHCKDKEREVLAFYADLAGAVPSEVWGYTTNGSSEGNLYGLLAARERYPDGMVYYSQAAHYSIAKNCYLLGLPAIAVAASETGEMDYLALVEQLRANPDRPAIVVATVGTTMTEARDDLELIRRGLAEAGIRQFHIHCDAALAGSYAVFMEPTPAFGFDAGADTVAISGYKFLGTPMPCGVILCRSAWRTPLAERISYIANPDVTISGSRSGHAPLAMWYALNLLGKEGLKRRYRESLQLAEYTEQQLTDIGWSAWRNPGALTVMLVSPPKELCYKWQLATADGWSHVICMPGITTARIDALIADLISVQAK